MEKNQVVKKVVSFSSQYGGDGSKSYTAGNLAGEVYNFPGYGDFTQAFVLVSANYLMFCRLFVFNKLGISKVRFDRS